MPSRSEKLQAFIEFKADIAQFKAAVGEATAETKKFTSEMKRQSEEARGGLALLSEELGIHLPRHLRSFVAELPGVGAAMSAAFNAVAVLVLIDVVVKGIEKIHDLVEKNREGQEKYKQSIVDYGETAQKVFNSYEAKLLTAGIKTDELNKNHVAALRKELQLIDMQGFDQLESAFTKLDKATENVFKNIQHHWYETLANLSFSGAEGFESSLKDFNNDYYNLIDHQKGDEAQTLLNERQNKEEGIKSDLVTVRDAGYRSRADVGVLDRGDAGVLGGGRLSQKVIDAVKRLDAIGATDYSDATMNASNAVTKNLEDKQTAAGYQRQVTASDKEDAAKQEAQKAVGEHLKALTEKLDQLKIASAGTTHPFEKGDELEFWQGHLKDFGAATEQYKAVIAKIASLTQTIDSTVHAGFDKLRAEDKRSRLEDIKFREEHPFGTLGNKSILTTSDQEDAQHAKEVAALLEQQAATRARRADNDINRRLANGDIGATQAANERDAAKVAEFNSQIATLTDELGKLEARRKGSILDPDEMQKIADEEGKTKAQIDKLNAESDAVQIASAERIKAQWEQALSGINHELALAMTGQKTNWSGYFRGQATRLAESGLKKAESFITGHHKADGYHVHVDNMPGGAGAPGTSGMAGGLLGMLNDSNWASSLFGGRLFGKGGIFGGFATGGDVYGGVPINVGELGPEVFVPHTNGRIVPNKDIAGGGTTMHIDARGTDPALTRENFVRALQAMHGQSVRDASRSMTERARRRPQ